MISLAENLDLINEFLSSCQEKSALFHKALIGTYGLKQSFFKVYVQKSRQIDAIISILDTSAFLTVKATADSEELQSFLSLNPFIQSVSMDKFDFDILGLPEGFNFFEADLLELKSDVLLEECTENIIINPKIEDIYPLMKTHFPINNRDEFISDMLHRINHGRGLAAAIYEENTVISCASIFFKGDSMALIGGVCTDSDYRKKGLASALVGRLSLILRQENLLPLITCKSEAGRRVYLDLGFTDIGKRITLTLKDG